MLSLKQYFWPKAHASEAADELLRQALWRFARVALLLSLAAASISVLATLIHTYNDYAGHSDIMVGLWHLIMTIEVFISGNYLHLVVILLLGVLSIAAHLRAVAILTAMAEARPHPNCEPLAGNPFSEAFSLVRAALALRSMLVWTTMFFLLLTIAALPSKLMTNQPPDANLTVLSIVVVSLVFGAHWSNWGSWFLPEMPEKVIEALNTLLGGEAFCPAGGPVSLTRRIDELAVHVSKVNGSFEECEQMIHLLYKHEIPCLT